MEDFKLYVFPERNIINLIKDIEPSIVNASSNIIFTLEVDYVANLDKVFITLEDQYNNDNKINLTNCSQVEGTTDKITCIGNLNYAGEFYIYLNNILQTFESAPVSVINNSTLAKALNIYPDIIRFNSSSKIETIEINFDSIQGILTKKITLKGVYNTIVLNYIIDNNFNDDIYEESNDNYVKYNVTFPVPDTYYVYIDNIYQNISVIVTTESFISKIFSIFPTSVGYDEPFIFSLSVDTNYGINYNKIFISDGENYYEILCYRDKLNKTKVFCFASIGLSKFYLVLNGIEFKNVTIKSKIIPKLEYFYPIIIYTSSIPQLIILDFEEEEDISNYTNFINFVEENSNKIIKPTCENRTEYSIVCWAIFENEGKYYLSFDGYSWDKYFFAFKSEENHKIKDESESEELENEYYSKGNYIYIKILFKLIILFLFV